MPGGGQCRLTPKLLFLVTEDWYFCSHRLPLARAAKAAGYEVHVVTRVREHGARIEEAGLQLHPLDMRRGDKRVWREVLLLARLFRLYRQIRPHIAHHVAMKPVLYGSLVAGSIPGVRIVNALAGLGYLFASETAKRSLTARLVRTVLGPVLRYGERRVIVQNADDQALMRQFGVAPEQIHLIRGSGVDVHYFQPLPEPPVPESCGSESFAPLTAAMVARLLWDKGIGELVEAARLLKARGVPLTVLVAGTTDPANPASLAEQQVRAWVAQGLVQWLGHVEDVREVWRQAHIAVLPSYREGLPKALLEAAACGRPLVATDVAGCREIAVAGVSAITVPAGDAEALAGALVAMMADAAARARMGGQARQLVESEFSETRVIGDTLALYAALLDATGGGGV